MHTPPTIPDHPSMINRRTLLNRFGMGLGGVALAEMLASTAKQAATFFS